MRKFQLLLFVLLVPKLFGQSPVSISIDSIKTDQSIESRRQFTVAYRVTNLTDKPISFFLNTHSIIPVVSSSGAFVPHYKLYKDGKSVDVSNVFSYADNRWTQRESSERYMDSLRQLDQRPEAFFARRAKGILESKKTLKPRESISVTIDLFWDLDRYQKQDEHEYFLEPTSKYTLELSMHLQQQELQNRLDASDYQKITTDPSIISGWFTSNQLPIDFSENQPAKTEKSALKQG